MKPLTQEKYLTDHELQYLKAMTDSASRDDLLVQVAIHTGARASEILNIEAKDLDPSTKQVTIYGLKGSMDRQIPIPAKLFDQLYVHARSHPKLFPISYQRLFQIWKFVAPNRKKFHALRHTFAINLYKRTTDIHLVRKMLGHKDLRNTMIYVDFVYSTQELRKLVVCE